MEYPAESASFRYTFVMSIYGSKEAEVYFHGLSLLPSLTRLTNHTAVSHKQAFTDSAAGVGQKRTCSDKEQGVKNAQHFHLLSISSFLVILEVLGIVDFFAFISFLGCTVEVTLLPPEAWLSGMVFVLLSVLCSAILRQQPPHCSKVCYRMAFSQTYMHANTLVVIQGGPLRRPLGTWVLHGLHVSGGPYAERIWIVFGLLNQIN